MTALISLSLCSATALAGLTSAVFVAAFSEESLTDSSNFGGQVKTRQYFDSGTGSESDPFVITRPVHLYNLSRLNELGLLSGKYYFQLGKSLDSSGTLKVYNYDSSGSQVTSDPYSTTLDMGWVAATGRVFNPIGSEAMPFWGQFEGNSIKVSDLTVTANTEDTGFFGYIASAASVKNLSFSKLKIVSGGYATDSPLYQIPSADYPALMYGASDMASITSPVTISDTTYMQLYDGISHIVQQVIR